jgi:hypothetical protein
LACRRRRSPGRSRSHTCSGQREGIAMQYGSVFMKRYGRGKSIGLVFKRREPRILAMLRKYSPDQPRDDHGRWTDGGDHSVTVEGHTTRMTLSPGAEASADQPDHAFRVHCLPSKSNNRVAVVLSPSNTIRIASNATPIQPPRATTAGWYQKRIGIGAARGRGSLRGTLPGGDRERTVALVRGAAGDRSSTVRRAAMLSEVGSPIGITGFPAGSGLSAPHVIVPSA